MVAQRNEKLKRLQHILPEGLVVDAPWLEDKGYSKPLRAKYLKSGWLEPVTRGLYRRPVASLPKLATDDRLEWERVVLSLQSLLGYAVHIGGRTVLEMRGLSHYLSGSLREVQLYADGPLPVWFKRLSVDVEWSLHPCTLFGAEGSRLEGGKFLFFGTQPADSFTSMKWGEARAPLRLSTLERAALELVDQLPNHETFTQVDGLFDGLTALSPQRLQRLLEACESIKTKRLFLFLAERHNHAWFKQLDVSRIKLGAGKRALVDHGRYDPKYRITVPDFLLKSGDDL